MLTFHVHYYPNHLIMSVWTWSAFDFKNVRGAELTAALENILSKDIQTIKGSGHPLFDALYLSVVCKWMQYIIFIYAGKILIYKKSSKPLNGSPGCGYCTLRNSFRWKIRIAFVFSEIANYILFNRASELQPFIFPASGLFTRIALLCYCLAFDFTLINLGK